MINKEACPVCETNKARYLFTIDIGQLITCQNCSLIYYIPRPSPEELTKFYSNENYRKEFSESLMSGKKFAKQRYFQFEENIKKYDPKLLNLSSKKILDIGCGTGDFLNIAQEKNWTIAGQELSSEAAISANQMLGHNCVQSGDLSILNLPAEFYDVVTIYHVIEHLISPIEMLQKIHKLVRPGGLVFVETPNIGGLGAKIQKEKWSQIMPPEHINYFQPASLKYCFNKAGFLSPKILTRSPIIIESLENMSFAKQKTASAIYTLAPLFNLGATLQGIARKPT
ncbi:MAG: class I SAM-dependent methyltransferase [Limnothrix sp.]